MLNTDCDHWSTCIFRGWLDFMKLLDMQSIKKFQDCWIHKKGLQSSYTYIFTPYTWCKLMNITLAILVCACYGGRDAQAHAVACLVGIAPSAVFWWGNHFHLLVRGAARLVTIIGPCWTVSGYCILQHRHRGCCPFVGGSRPKRSKFVSELSRFTL